MALRIGRCLLPKLLKKAKLTQVELAIRVGMSESTISQYAHNARVMSLLSAKLIAKELKVPIDDLYEWLEAD